MTDQILVQREPHSNIVRRIPLKDGIPHGTAEIYQYGDLLETIEYKYGVRNGDTVEYYADGKTRFRVTPYRDDVQHGTEIRYSPSGEIISTDQWVDGAQHGIELTYRGHDLVEVQRWKAGKRHGICSYYDDDLGWAHHTFVHGERVENVSKLQFLVLFGHQMPQVDQIPQYQTGEDKGI